MSHLVYPWLKTQWDSLSNIEHQKFPHAIILTGSSGIGKNEFAYSLSQSLLCQNLTPASNHIACGECASCCQFMANSHGDFLVLDILEDKKTIGVDQIREMIDWASLTSQLRQKKILLIPQSNKMTIPASNALLKTLEEPPADVVIILVCDYANSLLATIRSRCQIIRLPKPAIAEIKKWLDLNHQQWDLPAENEAWVKNSPDLLVSLAFYSPLKVKQLLLGDQLQQRDVIIKKLIAIIIEGLSPLIIATELYKNDQDAIIYWLNSLLFDLIYIHYQLGDLKLINSDYKNELTQLSTNLNTLLIFELHNELKQYYQFKERSLNSKLMLDTYLIKWQNCKL